MPSENSILSSRNRLKFFRTSRSMIIAHLPVLFHDRGEHLAAGGGDKRLLLRGELLLVEERRKLREVIDRPDVLLEGYGRVSHQRQRTRILRSSRCSRTGARARISIPFPCSRDIPSSVTCASENFSGRFCSTRPMISSVISDVCRWRRRSCRSRTSASWAGRGGRPCAAQDRPRGRLSHPGSRRT